MSDEPEVLGLLSLMLFCESRRATRRDALGRFVPLSEPDVSQWSDAQMCEADTLLRRAHAMGRLGRFQLEAAIQSLHAQRRNGEETRWTLIADLYRGLLDIAPTIGAQVGLAAAPTEAGDAGQGLDTLDAMDRTAIESYQPWWATRAHLLAQLGKRDEARAAYQQAAGLSEDADVRAFPLARRAALD